MRSYWIFFVASAICVGSFVGFLAFNEIQHNKAVTARVAFERPLPAFSFTDHTGGAVSKTSLLGKVWVADFIFTTCPGPCQKMSSQMREIQKRLAKNNDVRFVSFTVNPETDTPKVLAKYAEKFEAGPHWSFLTGGKEELYTLAEKGFLLSAVDTGDGSGKIEDKFIHDTKFAIVDRTGTIRSYIDGTADDAATKVVAAVEHYLTVQK
ncbi:MAG TPA: SCO family protein [Chthoniobacterales bacterium]|jgi:protein SCO1/2